MGFLLVLKGGGSCKHTAQGQDIWMGAETCVAFEHFAQWQTCRLVGLKVEGS